ncbi:hypothetical protein [Brevibacillus reuszeri]|uniref:hypothetical protein n=1 Tax=Brevibacillus reuszeri TaxID=54915 RepID=UPI003D2371A9
MNINKNNEELKTLYDELWNKLQDHDEMYVKKILNDCLKKLDKEQQETTFNYLKALFKKPKFWILFIALTILVPTILVVLFIWIALLVE